MNKFFRDHKHFRREQTKGIIDFRNNTLGRAQFEDAFRYKF